MQHHFGLFLTDIVIADGNNIIRRVDVRKILPNST